MNNSIWAEDWSRSDDFSACTKKSPERFYPTKPYSWIGILFKMSKSQKRENVILGGFLSRTHHYSPIKDRIERLSGQETRIVSIPWILWFGLSFPYGWIPILRRLEGAIVRFQKFSPDTKVTLIGHSIGGLFGLFYLLDPSFRRSHGKRRGTIDRLVTLGSPFTNRCRWLHGGSISRMIEKHGGVNGIGRDVRITCVAGKDVLGKKDGTPSERRAYRIYESIGGEGKTWGDGIVPVSSALLPGTHSILLENVTHFSLGNRAWYGNPEVVSRWWEMIKSA
jgi:hypothetical protein